MIDNQESLRLTLSRNWDLTAEPNSDFESLKTALTGRIKDLILNDFHRLVQAMYRLDIDEHKFHQALNSGNIDTQASTLTSLVLDREIQRLKFREQYGKQNN